MTNSIVEWLRPGEVVTFVDDACAIHRNGKLVFSGTIDGASVWQMGNRLDIINSKLNKLISSGHSGTPSSGLEITRGWGGWVA